MNADKAIAILEALASGCSPTTGEILEKESILNERDVIRALQFAIIALSENKPLESPIEIDQDEVEQVIKLLQEYAINPTYNRLTDFFLGTRKFKKDEINYNPLYGKYNERLRKGQLTDFFTDYLSQHPELVEAPYKRITFFQETPFNKLSDKAIEQLKSKINEIGIVRTEDLSDYVIEARKTYYRSHEQWNEKEIELLTKAIEYTNDLSLLSECFGRSKNSIEIYGQKILYKQQKD